MLTQLESLEILWGVPYMWACWRETPRQCFDRREQVTYYGNQWPWRVVNHKNLRVAPPSLTWTQCLRSPPQWPPCHCVVLSLCVVWGPFRLSWCSSRTTPHLICSYFLNGRRYTIIMSVVKLQCLLLYGLLKCLLY